MSIIESFDDLYDAIINSEPMPYATWKLLVDSADNVAEIATDAAMIAISEAFPIVGTIAVWLSGKALRWSLKQLFELIPHWSESQGGPVVNIPGREVPLYPPPSGAEVDKMKTKVLASIQIGTGGVGLADIAPVKPLHPNQDSLRGFQQTPIVKATIPVSMYPEKWTEQGRNYIPPSSIYGNRVPNIFVNRVGFSSF